MATKPLHTIKTIDTTKDVVKSQITMASDDKTETATQWSVSLQDRDQSVETDTLDESAKYMGDSEGEKKKAIKKVDKDEREDIAMSRDECDSSCPRRIPRSKYILLSIVLIDLRC
ncbi:uncharacterized protein LOC143427405 [Xylocopa sonorina]|uniref:uncharacterized protein LOC143427405 n=1 Tax=Xylocopa sonorina TaxID=1818115 RepID=UPI00403ADC5C